MSYYSAEVGQGQDDEGPGFLEYVDAVRPVVDTLGGRYQAEAREAKARADLARTEVERLRLETLPGYTAPARGVSPVVVVGAVAGVALVAWLLLRKG
jgi:glutamate synthase domain-containing protein 1